MAQPLPDVLPRLEAPRAPAPAALGLAALPDGQLRRGSSDAAVFTTATYAAQLILFVAGILQKRLLGPSGTGYWTLMTTFSVFFTLATFGVVDGGGRQVPFHRGRGDRARAASVANTAASFAVLTNGVAGLALAAVAFAFGSGWAPEIHYGLIVLGLLAPLSELRDAHEGIMRAIKRFDVSSVVVVVSALISLTLQTLFVWWFGFYGMFMGTAAIVLGSLLVWNRLGLTSFSSPAFRWRIERARVFELSRYGVPMMLQGQIWALFLVIDNLIVAAYIDVKHLGYYAVACSATSYIMLLPQSIGAALSPRMSERFGRTADERSIGHYSTDVQSLLAQLILPLMVGAAFFLMPVLIREGLPQFTPAIPVVRIMVAGSFFIALSTMPIKVLLAAGYRWSVTGLTLLALAVNAIANVVAVGVLSGGLTGAAYAVVFSYFFTFVVLTSFALTRTSTRREATAHMGTIVIMFAYTVGALWAIEGLLGSGAGGFASDVLTGVAKLAILVVLLTPWIALAQRRLGAFTALSSLARGAIHKAASRRSK